MPPGRGNTPSFAEPRQSVHRDGHVEVDKAFYSPPGAGTSRVDQTLPPWRVTGFVAAPKSGNSCVRTAPLTRL